MQKVSKQSLAMLALSILLAISIALTFTFAALTAQRTATGSITFSGNVAITYDGSETNGTFTLTPDYAEQTIAVPTNVFKITGTENAYIKITVTLTDASVVVTLKDLSISGTNAPSASKLNNVTTSATYNITTAVSVAGEGVTIGVNDIIGSITFDTTGNLTNGSISIKVEAQTNEAFAA